MRLFTPPYNTVENLRGVVNPESVQIKMFRWNYSLTEALQWTDHLYLQLRAANVADVPPRDAPIRTGLQLTKLALRDKASKSNAISYDEFQRRVFLTIDGASDPEDLIRQAAQKWNELVYIPMGEAAMQTGMIQKLRKNFVHRVWDHLAIRNDMDGFRGVVRSWVIKNDDKLDDAGVAAQTEKVVQAILRDRAFTPVTSFDTGVASGAHARVIDMPNSWRGPNGRSVADYIYTDVNTVGKIYVRTMSSDIELARQFGKVTRAADGTDKIDGLDGVRMRTAIETMEEEVIETIVNKAGAGKRDRVRKAFDDYLLRKKGIEDTGRKNLADTDDPVQSSTIVEKELEYNRTSLFDELKKIDPQIRKDTAQGMNDMQDVIALRDLIRGTFGQPDDPTRISSRVMHSAKIWTAATLLGGPLMSAIPDVAMPVLHEGMSRVFGGMFHLLQSNATKQIWKMSKKDSQAMGEVFEMALAARALSIAGATDVAGRFSRIERGLDKMGSFVFVANLFNPWNDFFKTTAGMFIWSRILDDAAKFQSTGKLSKRAMLNFTRSGITEDSLRVIADQAAKYGHKHKSIRVANLGAWDKTPEVLAAVEQLRQAVVGDIRRTIITPDKSDLPLWMSTEIGSVIGSLKTFSFATMQKILIPALQTKDQRTLHGITMLVAAGAMVEVIKRKQRGDDRELSLSELLYYGLDRSGSLSVLSDGTRILETLTDNRVGIAPLLGVGDPYPTSTEKKITAVGGAAVTSALNLGKFMEGIITGDATAKEAQRALIMGQTPWFQEIFRQIENHDETQQFTN